MSIYKLVFSGEFEMNSVVGAIIGRPWKWFKINVLDGPRKKNLNQWNGRPMTAPTGFLHRQTHR